jgi:hypothetical protein
MRKWLVVKYLPIVVLFALIVAILCMSRYEETRKENHQNNASYVNPAAKIMPNEPTESAKKADKTEDSRSWIETFTWPDGVTTWALLLTLLVIAWQSTETRAAARATEESVALIKSQVDLTAEQNKNAKDRERARLGIRNIEVPEVSGPENILEGMCPLRVCAFVENFGHSKAFNVRAYGILDIVSNPKCNSHEAGFLQAFPQIIDEGPEKHSLKLGGFGREFEDIASTGDSLAIPQETVKQIRDGKAFIQASGMLTYEDIFGDSQTFPFCFIWKSVGDDDGGKWLTRSFWLDCSPHASQQDKS